MRLSKELVTRFQTEHLNSYGKVIEEVEAERQLLELAALVRLTTSSGGENDERF